MRFLCARIYLSIPTACLWLSPRLLCGHYPVLLTGAPTPTGALAHGRGCVLCGSYVNPNAAGYRQPVGEYTLPEIYRSDYSNEGTGDGSEAGWVSVQPASRWPLADMDMAVRECEDLSGQRAGGDEGGGVAQSMTAQIRHSGEIARESWEAAAARFNVTMAGVFDMLVAGNPIQQCCGNVALRAPLASRPAAMDEDGAVAGATGPAGDCEVDTNSPR